ncbi:DNA-directed DNA polymerase [Tanacetum coccineum]
MDVISSQGSSLLHANLYGSYVTDCGSVNRGIPFFEVMMFHLYKFPFLSSILHYYCKNEKDQGKSTCLSGGSGPTLHLAARLRRLRGVVLHSAILSGIRVFYNVKMTLWFDIFENIDKIQKVSCPVLVIHVNSGSAGILTDDVELIRVQFTIGIALSFIGSVELINSLSFNPLNELLMATGSTDQTLKINSLSFNPLNELLMATGSTDKTLKVFDMRNLTSELYTLKYHNSSDRRLVMWDTSRNLIVIRRTDFGPREVHASIEKLAVEYSGNSYNLITRNCNHFCNDMCIRLTKMPIPSWVNRLARLGKLNFKWQHSTSCATTHATTRIGGESSLPREGYQQISNAFFQLVFPTDFRRILLLVALVLNTMGMEQGFESGRKWGSGVKRGVKEKQSSMADKSIKVSKHANEVLGREHIDVGTVNNVVNNGTTVGPTPADNTHGMSTSYVNVTGEPCRKAANFSTLITPAGNGVDMVVLMESIKAISEWNTWGKYGQNPDVNLLKEDVGNVSIWVKLYGVPMTTFSEAFLSAIATKLALIEIRADVELKDNIVMVMPKLVISTWKTFGGNTRDLGSILEETRQDYDFTSKEGLKNKSQMVETASGKLAMPSGSASDGVRISCDDLLQQAPDHGIKRWLLVQLFYDNMASKDKRKLDQFTQFRFSSLNEDEGWNRIERFPPKKGSSIALLPHISYQKKNPKKSHTSSAIFVVEIMRLMSVTKLYHAIKQIHINLPFLEAMIHMPKGAKVLKDLLLHKEKHKKASLSVKLSEECSTVIQRSLPQKEGDLGSFTLHCLTGPLTMKNALANLGAILEMDEDELVPIILDVIDVHEGKLSLRYANHTVKLVKEQWVDTIHYDGEWVDTNEKCNSEEIQAVSFYPRQEQVKPLKWKAPQNRPKPLISEPPKLELKELAEHLEYAFLQGDDHLLVVISSTLSIYEKAKLLKVLGKHKGEIAWSVADIKGIDSSFCTHKILIEDEYKTTVQPQRRVNPNIKEVMKKEVIKLLNAGFIYPISDSPWVSLVQVVLKKGGMTVIKNEKNKLIPQCTVTGWRVCFDYRKINYATQKDHFPLPFIDQMLERLAGHEYYYFLDGFLGYFQILIASEDQEKTMFTCPYGTFAYKRMPFGLCNAPTTFQCCMMAIF